MADKRARRYVDRAVAAFAAQRWGVFLLTDVMPLGLSRDMAADRVAAGRLWIVHRGVYSVVPPNLLKIEGRWLAAVLACGPGAVLSHAAAAALWGIRKIPSGPIDVTVPTSAGRRRRRGIRLHRSTTLLPSQTTTRRGVPATTVSRTLTDLRRTLTPQAWADTGRRAIDRGLIGHPEPSESELERRLLALCRRHRIPRPLIQQQVGPYTVDFLWPQERLIVEVDGFGTHGRRSAFEADRERDARLQTQGYRVVRFTWRQLTQQPHHVAATLHRLLTRR